MFSTIEFRISCLSFLYLKTKRRKTIIFFFVLCGCETLSFVLGNERLQTEGNREEPAGENI